VSHAYALILPDTEKTRKRRGVKVPRGSGRGARRVSTCGPLKHVLEEVLGKPRGCHQARELKKDRNGQNQGSGGAGRGTTTRGSQHGGAAGIGDTPVVEPGGAYLVMVEKSRKQNGGGGGKENPSSKISLGRERGIGDHNGFTR